MDISRIPSKLSVIQSKGGYSYQITPEDVIWLARSVQHESGNHAATAWTYAQRMVMARARSLKRMLQAHSQPINPIWRRDGSKCRPGGAYHGRDECSERRLAARDRAATMPWEDIRPEVRTLVVNFVTGQVPNNVPRAANFANAPVTQGYLSRNPASRVVLREGNWYITEAATNDWPDDFVTLTQVAGSGSTALFAVLAGVAAGVGFYLYQRKRKTGRFFGNSDDFTGADWRQVSALVSQLRVMLHKAGITGTVRSLLIEIDEGKVSPEFYGNVADRVVRLLGRHVEKGKLDPQAVQLGRRLRTLLTGSTGSFFGVKEDVDEVVDGWHESWSDSFWIGGPNSRSKGGDDGPRDNRRGASNVSHDRSGHRVVEIIEEYNCADLNNSIKRMLNAKARTGRLLAKYPDPEVFEPLVFPPEYPGDTEQGFTPDLIESWEEDLDDRIDILRSVARANGCSQVSGLR